MTADPTPAPDPTPEPLPNPAPAPPDPAPDPAPEPDPDGKRARLMDDLAKERDKRQGLELQIQTLQQAQQSQLDAIAKALGLKQDEPPDPEKLASQIADEQARTREASLQLAVYRLAGASGANPDALLDSASFLRTIADVDPADATAVTTAIKNAIEANEAFKAASPTPPFLGGPRPSPAPTGAGTLGDAIASRLTRPTR